MAGLILIFSKRLRKKFRIASTVKLLWQNALTAAEDYCAKSAAKYEARKVGVSQE